MKNKLNKRTIGLVAAALMLVATIGVGSALAYFTTYTLANGGKTISLNFTQTDLEETMDVGVKELVVTNDKESQDCYVRIKAIVSDDYKDYIDYSEPNGASNWTPGADGFYYYKGILAPESSTSQLNVLFELTGNQTFNIIIVQESTPVLYDADGNAYADWSVKADVSESVVPVE